MTATVRNVPGVFLKTYIYRLGCLNLIIYENTERVTPLVLSTERSTGVKHELLFG